MGVLSKKSAITSIIVILIVACAMMIFFPKKAYADPAAYSIGDTGPAGGFIFYDKGYDSDGWRYLEAAWGGQQTPYVVDRLRAWRNDYTSISTGTAIGTGKANTEAILAVADSGDNAAKFCDSFTVYYNGKYYDDWFLPSRDELEMMFENLKDKYIWYTWPPYWSSSQYDSENAYDGILDSGTVQIYHYYKNEPERVRPVRAFSVVNQTNGGQDVKPVEIIETPWIRGDRQMTCWNVWINPNGNFQFSFIYPYANNNWVRIYDILGKEVFSIDMPYDNPNFEVSLPAGFYSVKTFTVGSPEPIQSFIIGKS